MCDSLLTHLWRRIIWRGPASWCRRARRASRPFAHPDHALASSPRPRTEGASRMMRKSMTLTVRQGLMATALAASLLVSAFVLTACEDKAIGRRCDVQADAGLTQAVFNGQALECPTRI